MTFSANNLCFAMVYGPEAGRREFETTVTRNKRHREHTEWHERVFTPGEFVEVIRFAVKVYAKPWEFIECRHKCVIFHYCAKKMGYPVGDPCDKLLAVEFLRAINQIIARENQNNSIK